MSKPKSSPPRRPLRCGETYVYTDAHGRQTPMISTGDGGGIPLQDLT